MLSRLALEHALADLLEHGTIYLKRFEHALQVADQLDDYPVEIATSCTSGTWRLSLAHAA